MPESESLIILFDGVCNLCNGFVNFLIDRDPQKRFRFASLQSDFGTNILQKHQLQTADYESVIVLKNNQLLAKSAAVFEIVKCLKGWRWLRIFRFLPDFLLNTGYDFVARNRYRLFGKRETCRIPTPELKERFIE